MENVCDIQLTDDQHFLLYFIIGTYFGPHLKEGRSRKSALQIRAEGTSLYHANDLACSHISTTLMESVYYHVLRKAEQSAVVKKPLLLQYIQGNLPISVSTYPRFDDLFLSDLHPRSQFGNQCGIINNIIFIHNPETDFIKQGDGERFKRLSGLEDFVVDMKMLCYTNNDSDIVQHVNVQSLESVPMPFTCSTCNASPAPQGSIVASQITNNSVEDIVQGTIFLPSCPSREELSDLVASIKSGFAVTGSAATGTVGPVLGLMNIGESKDSYLFCVSLPGVRRDARDFSCEVESDGTVIIKGVTVTGERTTAKYNVAFEMQSQNLCPPGPFSVSFKLPGPVNPRQCHATFGTDGILEGIVLKAGRCTS